jgi:ketosteroid isomerase-like protein
MRPQDPVDVAVRFIESINRRSFGLLREVMADGHTMIDENGEAQAGGDAAIKMIRDYTEQWPDFQIHISDIHLCEDTVVVVGRTTGSCADKTPGEEIRERLLYVMQVEDGRAVSFRYALTDTDAIRGELGVRDTSRITR